MTLVPDEEKAKMRALSLTKEEDALLIEIGEGSRTAGVKELMELHRILKKAKGNKNNKELKYKLASMVEAYNSQEKE
jgi:hypothetical protein